MFLFCTPVVLQAAFIDVTEQTPVGHGVVLCFSVYGGDDLDFSYCEPPYDSRTAGAAGVRQRKDRIWVDVWDELELDGEGRPVFEGRYVKLKEQHPILKEFKRFFEDETVMKVSRYCII